MPMGDELKWLLKEKGWTYFQEPSLPKIGLSHGHSKVDPLCLKVGLPCLKILKNPDF